MTKEQEGQELPEAQNQWNYLEPSPPISFNALMSDLPPPLVPGHPPKPERKGLSTGCIVALVVGLLLGFIVVGILAAMAVPAANGVIKKAKLIRTKAEVRDVQLAIKNFYLEYAHAPVTQEESSSPILSQGHIIEVLMGGDKKINPRGIQYIAPPQTQQGKGPGLYAGPVAQVLIDSWGNPLRIALRGPNAESIANPEFPGKTINDTSLIWSAGPDGNFDTWQDNVASWKP